jgi:hypothetical protein
MLFKFSKDFYKHILILQKKQNASKAVLAILKPDVIVSLPICFGNSDGVLVMGIQ